MKIHSRFTTDKFLMYLIQDVTGKSTEEVVGFFYDLGKQVLDMGIANMTKVGTNGIKKHIDDFFPGTSIPFSLRVEGRRARHGRWDPHSRQYIQDPGENFSATIEVGFPEQASFVDQTALADMIMEKAIFGVSTMPPFEKPATKSPKMYVKLMKEISEKHGKKEGQEGNDGQ